LLHPPATFFAGNTVIESVIPPRRTPLWQPPEQIPGAPPAPVRGWLLDDGSLTQRLVDTGRRFSLQRWQQRWERPRPDEARRLQMAPRELALVRQVVLRLDGEAVVFARSVFPARSLTGPLLRLRRIANQSLGTFLFAQQGMRRSPFELSLLRGDSPFLPPELQQASPAWVRRSCFRIARRRLLVAEAFLEPFPAWETPLPLHRSRRSLVDSRIR